ncbi:M90 metallopeptidase family protein [Zavarzinella formosa]|uniref:hypothetical protein n=1 Tax=Zavarzinella formosa TaxID=360055 RepID=UPI00031E1865|nr:hypothetical protein [Zavarzinella formosa]
MRIKTLLILILFSTLSFAADPPPSKPASHTTKTIHGWEVRVDDRLLSGPEADTGKTAIHCVEGQLHQITLVLSAEKLTRLRKVPIWLDFTYDTLKPAQYHPSVDWLAGKGYDRALAKCVHIPNARYFVNPRHQREQPWAVMHELAHAYHDQVLDFENAKIKDIWQDYVKSGHGKEVLHINGSTSNKHYALTNQKEFFAEMTESYLGRNDFFPFNSAELKQAEPAIFKLMEETWGKLP